MEHASFGATNWKKKLIKRQEDLEIRVRVEGIQTTAWLRLARILKRVMEYNDNNNIKNILKNDNNNINIKISLLEKYWAHVFFWSFP